LLGIAENWKRKKMDEDRDVLGESITIANKVNVWVKKNWLTVIGIIIILSIVWYEQTHIQEMREEITEECNEHWHDAIERSCPSLVEKKVGYFNEKKIG